MSLWQADELAQAVGGAGEGFVATGVSIDTRSLAPGDLFVALQDARDGHDFVAEAFAKGAAGALVSRAVDAPGPVLLVDDTLAALGRLGAFARARGRAKIIAVTGSVGKTTTKEMLRRALGGFGAVHAAQASFNNHIGVPLTLGRMPRETDFAVLEIGMNHPGEILPLVRLARPDVAMVTGVAPVHIGLMGSLAAIAQEKASIYQGLAAYGVAVLPVDSDYFMQLLAGVPAGRQWVGFGESQTARVRLLKVKSNATGSDVAALFAGETIKFRLNAPGDHVAMNAVAALAACAALGLDVAQAAAGLEGFSALAGRGARRAINVAGGAAMLLDESYNASAVSIRAALAVLALQPGRHVAVLGDILELGDHAETEHTGLRADVAAAADIAFTCGAMMGRLFDLLPVEKQGAHAADAACLAPLVRAALRPGDAVLVKGSYGSRMRDVIAVLEGAG